VRGYKSLETRMLVRKCAGAELSVLGCGCCRHVDEHTPDTAEAACIWRTVAANLNISGIFLSCKRMSVMSCPPSHPFRSHRPNPARTHAHTHTPTHTQTFLSVCHSHRATLCELLRNVYSSSWKEAQKERKVEMSGAAYGATQRYSD
jgi:hypothetical protein